MRACLLSASLSNTLRHFLICAGQAPNFTAPESPTTTLRAGASATFEVVLRGDVGGHFEFRICDGKWGEGATLPVVLLSRTDRKKTGRLSLWTR